MIVNKILVYTETDQLSEKTTDFAVQLSMQMKVRQIVLLNIIIPAQTQAFTLTGDMHHTIEDMSVQLTTILKEKNTEIIDSLAKKYSSFPVEIKTHVTYHNSKTNLNEFMEEHGAGLLISSVHDHQGFVEMILGSRTEKLARRLDYPLIIIKEQTNVSPVRDIAVAIDVNNEQQPGLENIVGFAGQLNAKLHFLHVLTHEDQSSEKAIEKLRQLAKTNDISNYAINVVNNHSLENGIRKFTRKYNPDMIAVLTQGKGKIKNLLFGSGSEDIIKETDKPVFLSKLHPH